MASSHREPQWKHGVCSISQFECHDRVPGYLPTVRVHVPRMKVLSVQDLGLDCVELGIRVADLHEMATYHDARIGTWEANSQLY
ncbi:hypothetical protein M758_3G077900 [Ceratodon purpureus]|nr:hypothetical protein M758_3G077900 [Ceratodon purpureus]